MHLVAKIKVALAINGDWIPDWSPNTKVDLIDIFAWIYLAEAFIHNCIKKNNVRQYTSTEQC